MHFNFAVTASGSHRITESGNDGRTWQIQYSPTFSKPSFQEWQNLKTYEGTSPRVMDPWPPFCHYTFLTIETKCDMFHRSRITNIKVIEQNAFECFETYQGT